MRSSSHSVSRTLRSPATETGPTCSSAWASLLAPCCCSSSGGLCRTGPGSPSASRYPTCRRPSRWSCSARRRRSRPTNRPRPPPPPRRFGACPSTPRNGGLRYALGIGLGVGPGPVVAPPSGSMPCQAGTRTVLWPRVPPRITWRSETLLLVGVSPADRHVLLHPQGSRRPAHPAEADERDLPRGVPEQQVDIVRRGNAE